jgi:hypothetical protein
MRVVGGRVNGDGTVAQPGPFTSRRTATGDYTLTFADRLLSLSVNEGANGTFISSVGSLSGNACRVVTQSLAGAQTDRPFSFTAAISA